jgi:hypothetical protein
LTTTEDLFACKSKRSLIHIYTFNRISAPTPTQGTPASQYSIYRKVSKLRVLAVYLDPVLRPAP